VDAFLYGCSTLALWQAAATLDVARQGVSDSASLDAALAAVADAVQRQSRRMRATSAMLGSRVVA
jgi:hypothetical protein